MTGKRKPITLATILLLALPFATFTVFNITNGKEVDKPTKFPTGPVRVVIPGGPGGVNDRGARVISPFIEKHLGVSVRIENMAGADGIIAYNRVYKEKPDGYTLLSYNLISPVILELTRKTEYITKELSSVGTWNVSNFVIAVHQDNWKTFSEFLNNTRQKKVTLGGIGGSADLQGHLIEDGLGIKFNWVPYGSGQEAIAAVAGKHVDSVLTFSVPVLPMVRAGKLRVLAVFSAKRDPILPEAPTLKELGYDNITCLFIRGGLAAPPNTPAEIARILERSVQKATEDPEMLKLAERNGIIVDFQPVTEQNRLIQQYYEVLDKYKSIMK